jgi:hypothetical protein
MLDFQLSPETDSAFLPAYFFTKHVITYIGKNSAYTNLNILVKLVEHKSGSRTPNDMWNYGLWEEFDSAELGDFGEDTFLVI